MTKTYQVNGQKLFETETIEKKIEYDKATLEAEKVRIQALLDEYNK